LRADEDCETTESIIQLGCDLGVRDLQLSIKKPREQTQSCWSVEDDEVW